MKELFSHASSVFPVRDINHSIRFYTKQLGFKLNFTWEDPITYAVLARGEVKIHLSTRQDDCVPSKRHTALYIFVHDVDAVYEEFLAQNVIIENPPEDQTYKMREFNITDPDGYILTIGKGE